jgi:hypothetical protein
LYWWGPYPDLKIDFTTSSAAVNLTEASLASIACLGYEPPPLQSKVLNDFIAAAGYNRKYAIGLLGAEGKTKLFRLNGRLFKARVTHKTGNKRVYEKQYGPDVAARMVRLWEFFPVPLRGIDSDNGGEFINIAMKAWCEQRNITFTRSRSYHKNDNCYVE